MAQCAVSRWGSAQAPFRYLLLQMLFGHKLSTVNDDFRLIFVSCAGWLCGSGRSGRLPHHLHGAVLQQRALKSQLAHRHRHGQPDPGSHGPPAQHQWMSSWGGSPRRRHISWVPSSPLQMFFSSELPLKQQRSLCQLCQLQLPQQLRLFRQLHWPQRCNRAAQHSRVLCTRRQTGWRSMWGNRWTAWQRGRPLVLWQLPACEKALHPLVASSDSSAVASVRCGVDRTGWCCNCSRLSHFSFSRQPGSKRIIAQQNAVHAAAGGLAQRVGRRMDSIPVDAPFGFVIASSIREAAAPAGSIL